MTFQILGTLGVNSRLLIPGAKYNNSSIPETDARGPETQPGSLETELRVHTCRMQETLEHRITEDASQLGGPSQGRAPGLVD